MTVLITLIRRGLTHTIYMGLLEVGSFQRGWDAQKFLKDKLFESISGHPSEMRYPKSLDTLTPTARVDHITS